MPIAHYKEIQGKDDSHYPGSEELMTISASFGKHFGLKRLGIHHELLKPGRRTSYPHAESEEEEFVYVLEGNPDVWLDGELHPLKPGDAVGWPAGTGECHAILNNTDQDVRLLVVGETSKKTNKVYYPLNPERQAQMGDAWWGDVPKRKMGSHNGMPKKQ